MFQSRYSTKLLSSYSPFLFPQFTLHFFNNLMLYPLNPRATKRMTKSLHTGLLVLASATAAFAQGGLGAGKQGITDATTAIAGYFDPATILIYAIAAVAGLVGAFKVYSKIQSGDQDAQKSAMGWFGGMLFLTIVATVLRAVFL